MDAPSPDAAPPPEHEGAPPSPVLPPATSTWQAPGTGRPSRWRPSRTETRRRTFWLGCLTVILVLVLLVIAVLVLAGSEVGAIASFPGDTGGQITNVSVHTINGRTQWELFAAPGLDQADGAWLACDVVPPVFVRHGIRDPEFYVLNRAGDVIGSWQTSCDAPKPVGPSA
jgi:hypothetical protein